MAEFVRRAIRATVSIVLWLFAVAMLFVAFADGKAMVAGLSFAGLFGLAAIFTWPRGPNAWRNDPPTQRQLEYAADLGISVPKRATKGEVSDLISEITGR